MGSIIVITAPSGSGKSTLINAYMKSNKNASFAISHTTRAMRGQEQDGVEYHFIDEPTFKQMIASSEFVEWALVHDNYYGTSKQELENVPNGHTLILDIDVQGAVALQKMNIEALFIFVKPPSIEDLKARLVDRNTDSEDVIEKRLWNARRELEYAHLFNTVIINEELEKAQKEFDGAISEYENRVIESVEPETQATEKALVNEVADDERADGENVESTEALDTADSVENISVDDSVESDSLADDSNIENKDIDTSEDISVDVDNENKE